MTRFGGKVAIVTGGSSGIGRAVARALALEGAAVAIADVRTKDGIEVVETIRHDGGSAIFVRTDVSVEDEVARFVAETLDAFGQLDIAVNNAGVAQVSVPTHECTSEEWSRIIGVNLTGVWNCLRHEVPRLLERGGGAIVNVSSMLGLVGFPALPAYVASKHGVIGLTRVAALDYAQAGIRVNAVCPGVIDTDILHHYAQDDEEVVRQLSQIQPVGRIGKPEEVASAVLYLCSDEASLVTGQALAVDGGYVAG